MNNKLIEELVALLENEPGCGSVFLGFGIASPNPGAPSAKPQTAPSYQERLLVSASMDAARLYQLAEHVGGEIKAPLVEGANALFLAAGAGKYPPADLFQLMLDHWPPPPPSYTVLNVQSLAMQYAVEVLEAGTPSKPTGRKLSIQQMIHDALLHRIDGAGGSGGPSMHVVRLPIPGPPPR